MTAPFKIIIISAPSGAGKTTLIEALLKTAPQFESVITHTTRPIREGEKAGLHYHFVDHDTFKSMIDHHDLIEWAEVYGQYYGTSRAAIQKVFEKGKTPILNVDYQGARRVRQIFDTDVLSIFILPPSLQELACRLKARGDSPPSIEKRLAAAEHEISYAKEYDHVITNADFNIALRTLLDVLK